MDDYYMYLQVASRIVEQLKTCGLKKWETFKAVWGVFIDSMIRGFELVTCRFGLVTRGFELVTRRFELVTLGFELVTRGFELAHLNFNLCFSDFNSCF